ncbi:MAG: carbohydrate-binding domain-containing protein [Clostridia bacterium]|nr:carbohydrate-binding domain-containing protein [Lachnospiraceae bacterium]NCC00479.1 carbohydrate-binding domain-containing protein [Clostridia bacterium]NCD02490.1 carbohydrate-binding domain-containing protein [Clostridia bacterium]
MKRSKIGVVVLTGTMILSLLGGCSSRTESSDEGRVTETGIITEDTSETAAAVIETTSAAMTGDYDEEDLDDSWSEANATKIECKEDSITVTGNGAQAEQSVVKITQAGTYVISGTLKDGQIQVDADKEDMVHIILNGITASSSTSSVINGIQSEKIILTLAEGTTNTFSDGASYVYEDDTTDEPNACIFSKDDISINGKGTLIVTGNYEDGIRSKDDLKIVDGILDVTALQNGIKGKDSVSIKDGEIQINAGTDGIKSNNAEETDKGYVILDGGTYNITASQDGVQAETVLQINGGSGNITTGGGSANASYDTSGQVNENWGQWGGEKPAATTEETESDSAKALKAGTALYLNGGEFTIDSSDDSVHCNGDVEIQGGIFTMDSGDDGIHADNQLLIRDGMITINKSYEGLEGLTVEIQGGNMDITVADDGVNSAGGTDTAMEGRSGENGFASGSDSWVRISGGELYVNATGDGLDSNGNLYVEGGVITVEGPENSGNGTLDYGGTAEITGGTFIGVGNSGMAMGFSDSSSQYSAVVVSDGNMVAGTSVTVNDSTGKELFSLTPKKSYNCIQISSSELVSGETYQITYGDGTTAEVTLDGIATWSGSGAGGMGGMTKGGMGGGPGH